MIIISKTFSIQINKNTVSSLTTVIVIYSVFKMTTRKRSGSGSKRQFKEKVVLIYESFFRGEEKPPVNVQSFWDEFFLLKPKAVSLEAEILRLTNEQLLGMKENINLLFAQCVETLGSNRNFERFEQNIFIFISLGQEHHIRVVYALQTLCALTHAVYKKTSMESGFDVINILMGFSVAEERMTTLLDHINLFLTGNFNNIYYLYCYGHNIYLLNQLISNNEYYSIIIH